MTNQPNGDAGVLLIGNFLSATGYNRAVCEELAQRLPGIGWRVITASGRRQKLFRLLDMLLTVTRHQHVYSVAQIDVFSGPAFIWAEAVNWALRILGKPCVLALHGGDLPRFAARYPDRVSRLLASVHSVTAPSAYLKEALRPYRPDILLIPNPIEIRHYPFRERHSLRPNLIWLRAFHESYNPTMAIAVLSALVQDHPNVRLKMVGPDKGDGSLQRTQKVAITARLTERVDFPGLVPKHLVPSVLAQEDIFLNTTNVDNTPVSVIEAMACGLCVVSTRAGGTPYIIGNQDDGLLVERSDVSGMAAAVRRLLTDPELALRCSTHARKKVEGWDWSRILPQWDSVLRTAAGRSA